MSNGDPGFVLLILLVVMDLAVLGAVLFFMKTTRPSSRKEDVAKTADLLQSLVVDSGKAADQWRAQMEEKAEVMRHLNEQLEERISSLSLLCRRAEVLLHSPGSATGSTAESTSLTGREKKIISLAGKGRRTEEIADQLDLPPREVDLVLGLQRKLSQLGARKEPS